MKSNPNENYEDSNFNFILNYLEAKSMKGVKITTEINCYTNKSNRKCINEFENLGSISRGLIWKVKKVMRYFNDENGNLQTQVYAMKKTHINTQKTRRYYIDDQLRTYLDQICEEIRILSILGEHPNIAALYEVLFAPGHPYIYLVCEYCDLGTIMLKHPESFSYHHNYNIVSKLLGEESGVDKIEIEDSLFVKQKSLPFQIKKKLAQIIFPQILIGLKYFHENNIAHLDLKPENVVYSSVDSQVKLIDFSHSSIVSVSCINAPGGSVHFQAPELFTNYQYTDDRIKPGYYNPFKADVWSLGVFLFIFLTEEYPFDSDSELELQLMISNTEPKFPEYLDSDSVKLLSQLLEKHPDKRLTNIELILQNEFFKV